ncbi:Sec-independent protein translocase subunit TatB [Stackebrandtia nassauensis]|uniref:Sec-independent translocation protein mttA/Hcf106 n=1 Tax=Stackebrandtia nassauensis (strain DSM 44728 / CIP 108903 / NRRL B-16338 / NBRC 102104 / LLR-40K-21) TaxID=446470 RepID=D3Q720_STANL|nr:Sec-independent protein translocase subunit TatB [Stackebrandtia nassauensis]ADD40419.1 sec-independent translocation protein mttA/Hcf106 [Stackebrandtia nassauensis DSM 44728]
MLDNLGGLEIVVLLLVALFIIGPERLPKVLKSVGNGIRKLRRMASNATADISKEVGHDIDITDLHPKTFIRKHVLSAADEEALKNPLKSALDDVKKHTQPLRDELDDTASAIRSKPGRANGSRRDRDDEDESPSSSKAHSYDADAT